MSFEVLVDDNAHYRDDSKPRKHGEYDCYEAALAAAKGIVDEFLLQNRDQYTKASKLLQLYGIYGEDPYIVPDPTRDADGTGESFSARDYARQRCEQLFAEYQGEKGDE